MPTKKNVAPTKKVETPTEEPKKTRKPRQKPTIESVTKLLKNRLVALLKMYETENGLDTAEALQATKVACTNVFLEVEAVCDKAKLIAELKEKYGDVLDIKAK